jgi:hypothetical protein
MRKRNVLLIAKQSAKAEALVRFWPHNDWNLYLYTFRKKEWFPGMSDLLGSNWISHKPDPGSNSNRPDTVRVYARRPGLKRRFRQKTRGIRKYIHHKLLRLYDQQLLKWALPTINQTKNIAEKTKPDLVLSIYEPLAANLIGRRISAVQKIPWIAYFRDHCTTYNELYRLPILWQVQSACDIRLHAPLSSLVGVSQEFVDILSTFYHIPTSRTHVITGGFDDNELPIEIKERCIRRRSTELSPADERIEHPQYLLLSYVGVLYGHRVEPLVILLDTLKILADEGVPCKLQLILDKASHFLPSWVREKIELAQAKGLIIHFGTDRIPHEEALKMADAADVNLILEGISPAIAICASTLPIGDYLRETGIGIDCKDTDSAVAGILEVWRWKQGGTLPSWYAPVQRAIDHYSFRGMAEKMGHVLEQSYADWRQYNA